MSNRIIKFRVPHFDPYGVFVYFSYWGTIDYKGEPSLDHGCFVSPSSGMKKGWHEQFTGLTDKNGTDIYEGDIVSPAEGNYRPKLLVKWFDSLTWDSGGSSHPGFYFKQKWQDDDGEYDLDYHTGFDMGLEVIGNIHEHPELI